MNGRIYDPTLGRFLQADPHIQAPNNSQNYNRYSYVLNNPMSYTDPSGFFFKKLFKAIGGNRFLSTIISIGLNFIPGCQAWCSAAFNAAVTYAVTGSLKGALVGAFVGAISPGGFSPGAFLARGVLGGLASSVQGGKFGHGFIAAGAGGAASGIGNVGLRIMASAVIGGTVSKITGGKFANGASSAAFATLVTATANGDLKRSVKGMFSRNKGVKILKDNPENHGEMHSILGGSVKVARWGSKDATVSATELAELEGTLYDVTSTNPGQYLRGGDSVTILLNDEGAHFADLETGTMTIDMSKRGYFQNYSSGREVTQVSLHRLLAHEMSYLKLGLPDNVSGVYNAVNFADDVMFEINQVRHTPHTMRKYHGNGCVDVNLLGRC